MPDNAPDLPPVTPPTTPRVTPPPKKVQPIDAAHVPMSEEFDRAKWTLPPIGIVLIGLGIVAVVGALLVYTNRAKPVVAGGINGISAVQLPDNSTMASVQVNIGNSTEKQWYIQSIKATVKTDQGEWTDDAATATDSQRYFQAFPALGNAGTQVLKFDQKLAPGQQESGTVIFSFPITKDQFDQRKALTITIQPFDNQPVTFTK